MTKSLKMFFIAAALGYASLIANAVDVRNWIGGQTGVDNTEASPYDLWNSANWDDEGGIPVANELDRRLSVAEKTYIKSSQYSARISQNFCTDSGDFVFTGPYLWFFGFVAGDVEGSTVSVLKRGDWRAQYRGLRIGTKNGATATLVNESGNMAIEGSGGVNIAEATNSTAVVETLSGNWSVSGNVYVGCAENSRGTLTIKGGTVTVASNKVVQLTKGVGTINLDGGTLETARIIRPGSNGVNLLTLNFNGGTLKANAAGNLVYANYGYLYIAVNAGGGTIDCNGYAVTLDQGPKGRSNDFKGDGGLTFTGGNTITINNDVTYSGATRVVAGTSLKLSKASASSILSNGMMLIGAPDVGTAYTILTSNNEEDDWSDLDLSKVTCALPGAAISVSLGADGKSIVVTVNALEHGLYLGPEDGDLSDGANWSYRTVPTSGNAMFACGVPATLTKGETFAPTSITFAEGCFPVTINGDFTTLTCVTNNSSVNQTFAGFVDFGARDIDVTQTGTYSDGANYAPGVVSGGCVVFAGGVRGNDIVNHKVLTGHYELTKTSNFEAATDSSDRMVINENSSLSVKNADDTKGLYIGEGATFNVENFTRLVSGTTVSNRLLNWNKGACVVSNFTFTGYQRFWLGGLTFNGASSTANANAVLKIGTLTNDNIMVSGKTGSLALHGVGGNSGTTLTMYIGEGGLNIASGKTGYYTVVNKNHTTTMRPWNSDFTFGRGSNAEYDFLLGADTDDPSRNSNINFTFNTDDEAGVPRTITMDARIKTQQDTSTVTVAGHGTNVVTSASPLMTGTYAVTDAATVVLKSGAGFANGTVSVGPAATLAIGESGIVNPGNLTLADGAALAFNWTERAVAPVLDLTGKTLAVNGTVKVKVSADARIEKPEGGVFVLTSGYDFTGKTVEFADGRPYWAQRIYVNGDGNIVLDVGFSGVIIRLKSH